MSIRIITTKVLAAAALSASLLGIAAGTAGARPMSEAQCVQIENEMAYNQRRMNDAKRANKPDDYRFGRATTTTHNASTPGVAETSAGQNEASRLRSWEWPPKTFVRATSPDRIQRSRSSAAI